MFLQITLPPASGQMLIQKLAVPNMVTVHAVRLCRCARQKRLYAPRTGDIGTGETGHRLPRILRIGITADRTGHLFRHRTGALCGRNTIHLFAVAGKLNGPDSVEEDDDGS